MSPGIAVALCLVLLLAGLAIRVPIGVVLGLISVIGLWLIGEWRVALSMIEALPYQVASNYAFATIPMFVLMGYLANISGISHEMYRAARLWFGRMRGSLAIATIMGAGLFGAVSGSTAVSSAVFSKIALPEMLDIGYSKRLAGASVAVGGGLSGLIPPTIGVVIYGILTGESIGHLLLAVAIPGALLLLLYVAVTIVLLRLRPSLAPDPYEATPPLRVRIASLRGLWGIALVFGVVMGGIYAGWFTVTAASAVGALATMVIALIKKSLNPSSLMQALTETVRTTAVLLIIFVGGALFARFLTFSGVVSSFARYVSNLDVPPITVMLIIIVLYVFLGMLMDGASMMVVTLPLLHPLVVALGYDPIWFGVLVVIMVEVAVLTPPVGMNLFVVQSAANGLVDIQDLVIGVLPYLVANVLLIALMLMFHDLALWLPNGLG